MVFAARKKQLIAIQFRYLGRACGTGQQRGLCVSVMQQRCLILLLGHPKPQVSFWMCRLTSGYALAVAISAKHKSLLCDVRQGRDLPAL